MKIAVVGLGYVGLPVALAFAKRYATTVGFDINKTRVEELISGVDSTGEHTAEEVGGSTITFTADASKLEGSDFFIITVPTPVDHYNNPDLNPLRRASALVGKAIKPGSVVVFESTVYPGVTEEVCGPIIAEVSGLSASKDFFLGYSPERINPGDKEHTLEKIVKVVSGDTDQTLERVAELYESIIAAGVHRASSIKVAEAAKVIENTQRDLNIALMNELAIIFDKIGIATSEVLAAAMTKWNFVRFHPGLVGGHCIGVDPYYLTTKAEELGYTPQVILAGRRINDGMGHFIAERTVKLMVNQGLHIKGSRVGILGLTFKENISDLRNSRVPDIVEELSEFGVTPLVCDPLVDLKEAEALVQTSLVPVEKLRELDALILAVCHREFLELGAKGLSAMMVEKGVFVDVKSAIDAKSLAPGQVYWSL